MAQPLINIGAAVGDGTGEAGPRAWLQKLNRLPIPDNTVNPLSGDYAGTYEQKITLALADGIATGKKFCWITQPYTASLVTGLPAFHATGGRLIREGGDPTTFDVKAYGALGDGVTDDTIAIAAAMAAAVVIPPGNALAGSIVYFPRGKYIYTSTLQVPAITTASIILRGDGMRTTYLYPSGPSTNFTLNSDGDRVCLIYGTLTPDPAGTSTNQSAYCGMEELSQNGALISSGSVVAHQITEMQYGWMRNCIIENFPNASIGLYLRGGTATGGGASVAGPHVRLCHFVNCTIVTIGSNNLGGTPLLIQNADENSFINCTASGLPGQTLGADSAFCIWIQMGRNNRFYGCLESVSGSIAETGWVGVSFGPAQNRAGAANGQVVGNQFYGDVMEGMDRAVWFRSGGNILGNMAIGINPSIVTTQFLDDGAGGGRGNCVTAPMLTPPTNYLDGRAPVGNSIGFADGATTPSVGGGNSFACANSGLTTITNFTNGYNGQFITVRLDANTTIANGSGIKCPGNKAIVGKSNNQVAAFTFIGGGNWYCLDVSDTAATGTHDVLFTNAGLSTTSVSDASISSFSLLASTLAMNGQVLRLTARGRQTTQAGSFNIKFGATVLGTVAPAAGEAWEFEALVGRTGAASQLANSRTIHGTTVALATGSPAETLSGAITIDFRGSVTSGGTLNLDEVMIEYLAV